MAGDIACFGESEDHFFVFAPGDVDFYDTGMDEEDAFYFFALLEEVFSFL